MDHFLYKNGVLHAEDVAIPNIVASVGAPFYVLTATLTRHFQLFDDALAGMDHLVCYAMKAASNQAILQTLAKLGAGMDVVSGANTPVRGPLVCLANASSFRVLAKHAINATCADRGHSSVQRGKRTRNGRAVRCGNRIGG